MDNTSENRLEGLTPPALLPPHYFVACLVGIPALWLLLPLTPVLAPHQQVYGLGIGLLSLGVGVWIAIQGSRQFGKAKTNIIPFTPASCLVTDGVFRISRNPMYTGMVLALAGAALLSNQLWTWGLVVVFTLIIRYGFIAREEQQMLATFGDDYLGYQQRVRRWL